jgi:hypothetical protein
MTDLSFVFSTTKIAEDYGVDHAVVHHVAGFTGWDYDQIVLTLEKLTLEHDVVTMADVRKLEGDKT